MTEREQEILDLISASPQISQQELAEACNIARSSVAVHISNLIKKGIIRGKEYVIQSEPYVVVVGGQNIDIHGKPFGELFPNDSLPGEVTTNVGGVGMNISANLSALGADVKLISIRGDDNYASKIESYCKLHAIDIGYSLSMQNAVSATYLYITDASGEMQLAIADMSINDHLTPKVIEEKLSVINHSAVCVMDTNIPQETIEFIAKQCKVPLFVDCVSTQKAEKLRNILDKIHSIKCNKLEAESLSGVAISDNQSAYEAAKVLIEKGIENVFVTLGSDGIIYANKNESGSFPIHKTEIKNSTGAGDSCMAAIVWGVKKGLSISESAKAGNAAASICVESEETLNRELTQESLIERMRLINQL